VLPTEKKDPQLCSAAAGTLGSRNQAAVRLLEVRVGEQQVFGGWLGLSELAAGSAHGLCAQQQQREAEGKGEK